MPFGTPFYRRLLVEDFVTLDSVGLPLTFLLNKKYTGFTTDDFAAEIKAMRDDGDETIIPMRID